MNAKILYEALGEIKGEYIEEAAPSPRPLKRPRLRGLAAIAALALLLALPVRAEIVNGFVSNLLAPLYGSAQTELVDRIGIPVEATARVGEYILSADAVIGDKYNIASVYSLRRADGGPLEENICFGSYDSTIKRGSGGGTLSYRLSEDKTVLHITVQWTSSGKLFLDRAATVTFADLMRHDPDTEQNQLLEEGQWELKYMVRYEDSGTAVAVKNAVVTDDAGNPYTLQRLEVSPIGVHVEMTVPNFYGTPWHKLFTLSVCLDDGTVVELRDKNSTSHNKEGTMGAFFPAPIPLEKIREIRICGRAFPLDG